MPGESSRDDFTAAIADLEKGAGPAGDANLAERDPYDAGEPSGEQAPAADKPIGDRDPATGRYAPKTPAKDPAASDQEPAAKGVDKPDGTQADPAKPVVDPAPKPVVGDKAPASWKPEEREAWETMAPHHKAAVLRRENEVNEVLRTSVDARRWHSEFSRVAAPYEMMFRTENTDPIRAADYLFRTAATLRTAAPAQKAALVADMIHDFGIDLEMLDGTLAERAKGGGRSPATDPVLRAIDERLKPVNEFIASTRQQGQTVEQQLMRDAETQWNAFVADPANEFAEDLRQDMADLILLATKRNQPLGLQDAYKRAMLAHPTISGIVDRRKPAPDTAQLSAAARRAAEASASLPQHGGAPSRDGEEESDGSRMGDLTASIRQLTKSSGR